MMPSTEWRRSSTGRNSTAAAPAVGAVGAMTAEDIAWARSSTRAACRTTRCHSVRVSRSGRTSRLPSTSRILSVLRIITGLLFLMAGTQKLFGLPPSSMPRMSVVLMSRMGDAGILETFGGSPIILGLFTAMIARSKGGNRP